MAEEDDQDEAPDDKGEDFLIVCRLESRGSFPSKSQRLWATFIIFVAFFFKESLMWLIPNRFSDVGTQRLSIRAIACV